MSLNDFIEGYPSPFRLARSIRTFDDDDDDDGDAVIQRFSFSRSKFKSKHLTIE